MTDILADVSDESPWGETEGDANPWTDTPTEETATAPSYTEPEEVKPQVVHARTKCNDLIAAIWGGIGGFGLVNTRIDPPVGRMMQLQAPLAGEKIDALIAGTWIDNLLQPLARKGDAAADVMAIIAGPLLIGMVERNPETIPMVEPFLRQVVEVSLVEMAPILKKKKRDQRRAAAAMADINEAFDIPSDMNPFDAILSYIFQGGEATQADFQGGEATQAEATE
jgi:hypothetical protein